MANRDCPGGNDRIPRVESEDGPAEHEQIGDPPLSATFYRFACSRDPHGWI
jgi:hypothetical protein